MVSVLLEVADMKVPSTGLCSHFNVYTVFSWATERVYYRQTQGRCYIAISNARTGIVDADSSTAKRGKVKAFLAAEYAAGRPVTVWYEKQTPTETPLANPLKSYPLTTIIEQDSAVKGVLMGTCKVVD
jgi:hypothetical protein